MNTPSPLIPQGATPPRPKNSLYIKILMVLSVHVVVIGGMLVQGCNNTSTKDQAKLDAASLASNETAAVPAPPTYTAPATPPITDAPVTNPSLTATSAAAPLSAVPGTMTPPAPGLVSTPKSTDLVPPAAPGESKEYVIAKGDTLAAIAHKNGLSLKALQEANPNLNAKKLHIGQKVQIPGATVALSSTAAKEGVPGVAAEAAPGEGTVYVVKTGDILLKIAKAHGTTVKKIMAMNDLKSTSIRAGQKLKLPAAKTSATEPAATTTTTAASAALTPAPAPFRVSAATPVNSTPVAAN
jgi:LysM repeat protein